MKAFHVTLKSNLNSILRFGLDPDCSIGKMKTVWVASSKKLSWAIGHVGFSRGHSLEELVILTVNIPRAWLRRRRDGIWLSDKGVPPSRITDIQRVGLVSTGR